MKQELLSVCIPTRNRAGYLRDLLAGFAKQVTDEQLGPEDLVFYISDNTSDDETPEVIREFSRQVPGVVYNRNPANIGGDNNILHVRTMGRGKYIWVVGDDELLANKALVNLLVLLRQESPGLILAYATRYDLRLKTPQKFADYKEFARQCIHANVHALAEHSLISSNIYRADCYDYDLARETLSTHFPQMYGMVRALHKNKAPVILPDFPVIIMRDVPAMAVDGLWVSDFDAMWINYFKWLREELQLSELDPLAPSQYARRALIKKIFRHPFRFFAANWRSILNFRAYFFAFNRLFLRRE